MTEHLTRDDEIRIRRVLSAINQREQQAANMAATAIGRLDMNRVDMVKAEAAAIQWCLERAYGLARFEMEEIQDKAREHG